MATPSCCSKLPLGDFHAAPGGRGLADIAREYGADSVRLTADQEPRSFAGFPAAACPRWHERLAALGLAEAGAETISDASSCPGTDTCKRGIWSSRGLAGELRKRLTVVGAVPAAAGGLPHIKCSVASTAAVSTTWPT